MNPTDYLQQVAREKANAKRARTVERKRKRRERAARTWPTSIPHLARALLERTNLHKGPIQWTAHGSTSQPYVTLHLRRVLRIGLVFTKGPPILRIGGCYRKQPLQAVCALISSVSRWQHSLDETAAQRRGDDLRFFPTEYDYQRKLWTMLGLGRPQKGLDFLSVPRLCPACGVCAAGEVYDEENQVFWVGCAACDGGFTRDVFTKAVLEHVHTQILGKGKV